MHGDDLAIFLFWATLAIGFGVESVKAETAARRKAFGGLAGLFLLAGIFWLQIKTIWPPLTEWVTAVATNPTSWFVLLMFIAAVFAFSSPKKKNNLSVANNAADTTAAPTAKENPNSTKQPIVDTRAWFHDTSIAMLASNEINQLLSDSVKKLNALQEKIMDLELKRREVTTELGPFGVLQTPTPAELAAVSNDLQKANEEWFAESAQYTRLRNQMLDEIYGKLSNGLLIAKGFIPPLQSSSEETFIPQAQWRFLRFDKDLKNVEGGGVTYLAVAVARS